MELVIQLLLLLLLLMTHSAGARLLDDDSTSQSHKKSTSLDPNFTTALKSSVTASPTQSDVKSAIAVEILQKESVPEAVSSGQSPGVGQYTSLQNAHNRGVILSGESPDNGGMSVEDAHIEGVLSSGQSPGVGHMSVHRSHIEGKLSAGQSPGDGHIEGMLSSGQSPGVGHMSIHNAHIKGMLSSSRVGHMSVQHSHGEEVISTGQGPEGGHVIEEIMLPSGNNPGFGHMSLQNTPKKQIFPSEESPDVGDVNIQDAHIEGILDSEKKMSTMNMKLPSGSSPGVGHMVINSRQKRKASAASHADKVPSPEADNSFGLGYVEKKVVTEDETGHVKGSGTLKGGVSGAGEGLMGSMKGSLGAAVGPENGHSAGSERKNGGEIIGCAGVGVGQPSGSINLFSESSYYGAPTSLVFGIAGKDKER